MSEVRLPNLEQGLEDYAGAAVSGQHSGPHPVASNDRSCQGEVNALRRRYANG